MPRAGSESLDFSPLERDNRCLLARPVLVTPRDSSFARASASHQFEVPVMDPDHRQAPDLGLKVEDTPALTRLRVPSRMGVLQWIGLALLVGAPLFVWTILAFFVLLGATEMAGLLVAASVVLVSFSAIAMLLAWRLRSGATVTISRDRVKVARPWASQEMFESLLSETRCRETPEGILVIGGGEKVTIGSALKPAQRTAVVAFLNHAIESRLPFSRSPISRIGSIEDGVTRESSISADELSAAPADRDPQEIRLVALLRGLKAIDKGNLVHLAPNIPQSVLVSALQSYLDLQDDEVLLSIAGVVRQGAGIVGCAVTTKRVYWPGKRLKSPGPAPPRCRSLDHASLPGIIRRKPGSSALELGEGRRILCSGAGSLADELITALAGVRAMACGDVAPPEISEQDLGNSRLVWPRVVAANTQAKALHAEIRNYVSRTQIASSAVITQMIVLTCFGVFAAMVSRGISAFSPSVGDLIAWGADSAPHVAVEHQYWRLVTAVFPHIGLFHLLMNMLCLITTGPVVERFFGHLGFAALYVLSGLGGAIASVWAHPTVVSAGASGAIFGVIGGLLGFLALRHRDVPPAVLKPMRVGAIAFVGYNTLFSLTIPGIDMAAHLGGLATGFVCGLLMTLVSPRDARAASRLMPALRRAGVAAVVALGLAGIAEKGFDAARRKILADGIDATAGRLQTLPDDPSAKA
jgi:membrane associated rhomboid family serine protease